MSLDEWAQTWGVSVWALKDLRRVFGLSLPTFNFRSIAISEAANSNAIRVEASLKGMRLFRNNVGAGTMDNGNFVRFGLANDSSVLNKAIKSADLIGIRPIMITPLHVGQVIGQFVSREVKAQDWRYTGTEREVAQLRWAEIITGMGGDAMFATGTGTL